MRSTARALHFQSSSLVICNTNSSRECDCGEYEKLPQVYSFIPSSFHSTHSTRVNSSKESASHSYFEEFLSGSLNEQFPFGRRFTSGCTTSHHVNEPPLVHANLHINLEGAVHQNSVPGGLRALSRAHFARSLRGRAHRAAKCGFGVREGSRRSDFGGRSNSSYSPGGICRGCESFVWMFSATSSLSVPGSLTVEQVFHFRYLSKYAPSHF